MRVSLAIVAVLAIAASAVAVSAKDACGGRPYGQAGDFDFYVFAQSWPAQFCMSHKDWPGCRTPTHWQAVNLTLHGMWPNYDQARSGHGWPQCCPSPYGSDVDPQVVQALLPSLQEYWPNEQDPSGRDLKNSLWAHEWSKHGTCSGMIQRTYFISAMQAQLDLPTPRAISDNVGSAASLAEIKQYYKADNCSPKGDCPAAFQCTKYNGQQYLSGVTTCLDRKLNRITCPAAVVTSQGGLCTDEKIYIQSF